MGGGHSLGNFLCNPSTPGTDEGVILNITYHKIKGVTEVTPLLTFIQKYYDENQIKFRILPVNDFLEKPDKFIDSQSLKKLQNISVRNLIKEN